MSAACTAACGWCGRCTAAWELPDAAESAPVAPRLSRRHVLAQPWQHPCRDCGARLTFHRREDTWRWMPFELVAIVETLSDGSVIVEGIVHECARAIRFVD